MKEKLVSHRILNWVLVTLILSTSLLLVSEIPSVALGELPLKTGVWKVKANGFIGELNIQSVDTQGKLTATLIFPNQSAERHIVGFWDERSQKITFIRLVNLVIPDTYQVWTGYQFCIPRDCASAGTNVLTLAGSFEAFSGTGGTAQRSVFGWYAETTKIGP
jgi:hypothetical protein